MSNEVKDLPPLPVFSTRHGSETFEEAGDQIILSLTCFDSSPVLKEVNGAGTLPAVQGHNLWSVLLLANHSLSHPAGICVALLPCPAPS